MLSVRTSVFGVLTVLLLFWHMRALSESYVVVLFLLGTLLVFLCEPSTVK